MNRRTLVSIGLFVCLASSAAPAEDPYPYASWRGMHRKGVFPASGIVTSADEATGKNIVWKRPLPFIGNSSPVYANGLIFVLCDGGWKTDAPILLAIDVKTGQVAWQKPVDNLDAREKGLAEWARAQRAKEMAMARRAREFYYRLSKAESDEAKNKILAEAKSEGFAGKNHRGEVKLSLTSGKMVFTPPHAKGQDYKKLSARELFAAWEGWYYAGIIYTGSTFPSAVCDEKCVYVWTNQTAAACFDMAGNRKWIVDLEFPQGGHGSGPITTASATLVGDAMIVSKYDWTAAVDKRTGKELWRHKHDKTGAYQPNSAATPFRLDGTDYIYIVSGEILKVADGSVVGKLIHPADVEGKKRTHGMYFGAHSQSIARDSRIWVMHNGYGGGAQRALGGIYCFDLSKQGDKVTGKLRWQASGGGDNFCIALDGNELYAYGLREHRDLAVLKADSGELIRKGNRIRHRATNFAVTDKYLIMVNQSSAKRADRDPKYQGTGTVVWYDKKTLKQVGSAELLLDKPEGEVLTKRIARVSGPWWGWGRSSPTAWGNRVFVRSHDALYCIGDPDTPFAQPEK